MARVTPAESWLCDMDGVLIREGTMIPGADIFLERLRSSGRSFLILTNNSAFTPRDLAARLESIGLEVPEEQLWTSALATAKFVADQRPEGTAYVIGDSVHESGLIRGPAAGLTSEDAAASRRQVTLDWRLFSGQKSRVSIG